MGPCAGPGLRRLRVFLPFAVFAVVFATLQACSGDDLPDSTTDEDVRGSTHPGMQFGASAWLDQFDIEGSGIVRGSAEAPVRVIEFSDFACPHCAHHAHSVFDHLAEEFVDTGQVQWRYIPIMLNPTYAATQATYSAMCVAKQSTKRFWEYRHLVYLTQRHWVSEGEPEQFFRELLDEMLSTVRSAAAEIDDGDDVRSIDLTEYERCMSGSEPAPALWQAENLRINMRVRGTPTFIVDGFGFAGSPPLDQFRDLLSEAVAQAQVR